MNARACCLLLASLALAGCSSSPPTSFYTLEPVAPEAGALDAGGEPIAVGRVTLPPELERDELVRWEGNNSLSVASIERWAAPLATLVRRTLALDLAARLPDRMVFVPGQPGVDSAKRYVVVTFAAFGARPDGEVAIGARWCLTGDEAEEPIIVRDEELALPIESSSGADIAAALSAGLGELADRIAAALAELEPGEPERGERTP